ncbi:hypothetical protein E4191_08105 [Paracoccus liaowanqingii]|uniref:Uncharacterized protein n=1 Tax=Paracoccus liaowanqingii TaxID=2560053 RepID=A0A4P7HKM3_9RHOB|nr:hypothetical protein [Paracoccus liaowanqingii]QBX34676.1 hypothetical protein E4191_08105 [Paracoccus liaowanqingii]
MEIYVRAELPESCYIHEAALWVSLGIVPRFLSDGYGNDIRSSADEHLDQMQALTSSDFFEVAPVIQTIIKSANPERFSTALALTYGRGAPEIEANIRRLQGVISDMMRSVKENSHLERIIADCEVELSQDEKALEAEALIRPYISELERRSEIGQAAIFNAVASGRLSTLGVRVANKTNERSDDGNDENISGEFQSVPAEHWRQSSINWRTSAISIEGDEFGWVGVQMLMRDLLKMFPRPEAVETPFSGLMSGAALILDANHKVPTSQITRRPGRPGLGDGNIQLAVRYEFTRRRENGELPKKVEAINEAVAEWVKEVFNQKPSRSSVQRYLADVLSTKGD